MWVISLYSDAPKVRELKRGEASKTPSPFPLSRGRGIKGVRLINNLYK